MNKLRHRLNVFGLLLLSAIVLSACSGGSANPAAADPTAAQADPDGQTEVQPDSASVSFDEDIMPILNNKCVACHDGTPDSIGPLNLTGEEQVMPLRSAILSSLENRTMPMAEAPQLTPNERAKFVAWLTDAPYYPVFSRLGLINHNAWDVQSRNRDTFLSHRPSNVACEPGKGWEIEDNELEVDTALCNYLGLSQQLLLDLDAGQEIEVTFSHSDLNFNAPATAHFAMAIAGEVVLERDVAIPSAAEIVRERFTLPNGVRRGDEIEVHLHNHGDNSWTVHSIDAFIEGEPADLDFCPTYDSTFAAIQETVFEAAGCTNSLCHADSAAGGLDLRSDVAYQNILGVRAQGSSLSLINPRRPNQSYLYQKLVEKTFPGTYDIGGAAMPSAGSPLSAGQLEAMRIWIEAGAPETGSVGDTLGRGENELEQLLGVCLPEPEAVGVVPLEAPPEAEGVQFRMPSHAVNAEAERELCFATYYDFRDQVPAKYLDETGDNIYVSGQDVREDPYTHHNVLLYSGFGAEMIGAEEYGEWQCAAGSGDLAGNICDPLDRDSCGEGMCRSELKDSIACRGFGPNSLESPVVGGQGVTGGISDPGFFKTIPSHGIYYWNSHAFNLTTEDANHRVWRNIFFTDDLRFAQKNLAYSANIFKAAGVPPFSKQTVCADYTFDEGAKLVALGSHTHKRGGYFFMTRKHSGELIYESFNYDDPIQQRYDPAIVFDSPDIDERTIEYCAEYTNGLNPDGSMNVETVTRQSRKPSRSRCVPTACAEGKVGEPCNGSRDSASCDTSPGAGDGMCDACPISAGITSDDEMFLPLITRLVTNEELAEVSVSFTQPAPNSTFNPGQFIPIALVFNNFDLQEPLGHNDDNHDHGNAGEHSGHDNDVDHSDHDNDMADGDNMQHMDADDDHAQVTEGHYHLYLDTDDDAAEHVTAWSDSLGYALPIDIEPGEHTLRISLRAPDHHAIGIEETITFTVVEP